MFPPKLCWPLGVHSALLDPSYTLQFEKSKKQKDRGKTLKANQKTRRRKEEKVVLVSLGFNRPMLDLIFNTYKRTEKEWLDVNHCRHEHFCSKMVQVVLPYLSLSDDLAFCYLLVFLKVCKALL